MLQIASQNWLCRNIRRKQKHDGTSPNSMSVGNESTSISIDQSILDYDRKGRDALDKYIQANTGDDVADDDGAGLICLAGEDL